MAALSTVARPKAARVALRAPACSVNVPFLPNRGRGGGGFRRWWVVASAFGDVQVAGVLDGRDDRGADGGQVGGPAAGTAGGGVFAERRVPDVVMCLDGPVLADQAGQVLSGGVSAGQASGGVGGLAGDLAGGVSFRQRQILMAWQACGKSRRLTWAAFRVRVSVRPCPVSRVELPAGTCRQGSALTRACSSGWFCLITAM
jgi:hypothetical protein